MKEIGQLQALTLEEARDLWVARLRSPLPAHRSRDLLIRALAYQLQARAQGGLDRSLKRKLEDLAVRFSEDRAFTPAPADRLKPGNVLVRDWNGRRYAVTVTDTGFLHDGQAFISLSAVARAITGTHWSGPRFFQMTSEVNPP